jgi:hypothetical protein
VGTKFRIALAEARKYGLNLVLAHQYLEQLDEKLRAAVFGNVGTIISFRIGVEDAKLLAREFHPTFSETDLANLPNHSIYLKLLIDGKPSHAFSAITLEPRERHQSYRHEIIDLSRRSYGRPRQEVEKAMSPWTSYPATVSDQRRLI